MAKIVSYKFVSPVVAADAAPETKASGNLLVAQNRIGKTVEGIGATLEVIVSGNNSYLKFLNEQKKQKKIQVVKNLQWKKQCQKFTNNLKKYFIV